MFNLKKFHNYKLFLKTNKEYKKIVFYSEGSIHDHFYLPFINICLSKKIPFTYISSENIKPFLDEDNISKFFYIGDSFTRTLFFLTLNCKNLITTTPDLNNFHLRKSNNCKNYIYFFHSMCSVKTIYNNNAFSHYDTILTANKFHTEEFKNYYFTNSNVKILNIGYPKIDELYFKSKLSAKTSHIKSILIAPSWGDEKNTFNKYSDLIKILIDSSYNITFRPHPVTFIKSNSFIKKIEKQFSNSNNFKISNKKQNVDDYILNDLIITDWSGSAVEYALATSKPSIFINTNQKIRNKNCNLKDINNSFEVYFRKNIGQSLELTNLMNLPKMISNYDISLYEEKIEGFRKKFLYNFINTEEKINNFLNSIK